MLRWARHAGWTPRAGRTVRDSRGATLLTSLFIAFFVGLILAGFVFSNQNEINVAALQRNSTEALDLAEGGATEAKARLKEFGAVVGDRTNLTFQCVGVQCVSAQKNSLAPSAGRLYYEGALKDYPAYFTVLSRARFGEALRAVRALEWAQYRLPPGNVIYGPDQEFHGDASSSTGDLYSTTGVTFDTYKKSIRCASGADAGILVSPQVFAATTIGVLQSDANVTNACGKPPNNVTAGFNYHWECADQSLQEVPPTSCTGHVGGRANDGASHTLPVNWHPMAPIGMPKEDFTAVIVKWNGNDANLPDPNMHVYQALQNSVPQTYAPGGNPIYTPSYWTSVPTTNTKIMVFIAPSQFCVNAGAGNVTSGPCGGPGNTYGVTAQRTRYLDWGLVQDDLRRGIGQLQVKFYTQSLNTPCDPGACHGGNFSGIRYMPPALSTDIMSRACRRNVPPPGTNVFDNLAGPTNCPVGTGVTTIHTANPPAFDGTRDSPKSLVIDNAGLAEVHLTTAKDVSKATPCSGVDFNTQVNWGIILATGNIRFDSGFAFSGFIYTPGEINTQAGPAAHILLHGGVYASKKHLDTLGVFKFCNGSMAQMPLSPLFHTFTLISWQDVPLNQIPGYTP